MSRFQYSSALGDGSSLFAPRSKMSATAAALIGGGVALASGLANLWNQADTNKANREINESQLEWQKHMYYDQQHHTQPEA